MQDKLTGFIIEYPVRCKHTDNFQTIFDLRSVIADFVYDKQNNSANQYICCLCNQSQNIPFARVQILNHIYLDQNLISQMQNDMSYLRNKIFNYDGKSYLKQELLDKYKFEIEEYISKLQIKTVEFRKLYCSFDKQVPLLMPLILKQCPIGNIVDFDTFYKQMESIQFNFEQKGLMLCDCEACSTRPIRNIKTNVAYHEAFGWALSEFRKTELKPTRFIYNFETMSLIFNSQQIQLINEKQFNQFRAILKQPEINKKQFNHISAILKQTEIEILKKAFRQRYLFGMHFQILCMEQEICDGLIITYCPYGVEANLEEKLIKMNEFAKDSYWYKRFHFKVIGISLELKNDIIKVNVGSLSFSLKSQ